MDEVDSNTSVMLDVNPGNIPDDAIVIGDQVISADNTLEKVTVIVTDAVMSSQSLEVEMTETESSETLNVNSDSANIVNADKVNNNVDVAVSTFGDKFVPKPTKKVNFKI